MRALYRWLAVLLVGLGPASVFARGESPDLNIQVKTKGLGREYFFGHNIPISTSQAAFVAAVNQEHASGGGTVHVVSDTPIGSAVTVPSDVRVIVEHGAKFLKQTGGSLTFNGPSVQPLGFKKETSAKRAGRNSTSEPTVFGNL